MLEFRNLATMIFNSFETFLTTITITTTIIIIIIIIIIIRYVTSKYNNNSGLFTPICL